MEFQFLLLLCFISYSTGLKCYSCTQSGSSDDQICLKNPGAASESAIIKCNKKYCITFRQELIDPPGLATFSRGCEDTPVFLNKDVTDEVYKTYYRACTKSLCNNGTGKEPIFGNGFGGDIGTEGIIYVKGIGTNSANTTKLSFIMVFICSLLMFYI
ncbi:uncharacterized protein LOC123305665 [Chrysoperla carnea]|uniref:uncharacterized protein LOC123305665 n=1 Tax=Chrysoperla carnea TaxID=189513 RepID=UPI001D08EF9C|nr:uncharacterized protein LOC123305665 [Chrysoperla carnea]